MPQNKKKYTKQDSTRFLKYQQDLQEFPNDASKWVPESFKKDYATWAGQGGIKKDTFNYEGSESFRDAEFKEDSAWLSEKEPIINSLDELLKKDMATFRSDSSRYSKLGKEYDVRKTLWEAREGEVPFWDLDWVFNTYDKKSSLGVLNQEMSDIREERREIHDKYFRRVGRGDSTGEEKLRNRERALETLNTQLKTRKARFNKKNLKDYKVE